MQIKFGLKMVLECRDREFLGTTTITNDLIVRTINCELSKEKDDKQVLLNHYVDDKRVLQNASSKTEHISANSLNISILNL